uniref:Uncharacterized protein n=1 Tax=Oryza brachyantha TaxID=4533 RepID=J3NB16_ORYBR
RRRVRRGEGEGEVGGREGLVFPPFTCCVFARSWDSRGKDFSGHKSPTSPYGEKITTEALMINIIGFLFYK